MRSGAATESATKLSVHYYYAFKIATVLVAGGAIYLGYRLFIKGVTGQASIVVNSPEIGGQLLNAAPGLIIAVCGIAALIAAIVKGVDVNLGSEVQTPNGLRATRRPTMNEQLKPREPQL